jgi:hypothetical protein
MKNKTILLATAILLLFGTASPASAQVGKDPKGPLAKLLPDLVVGVTWNKAEGKANVTIKNICKGKSAPTGVSIFVYGSKDSPSYTTVISDGVPGLASGGSYSHLFSSGYLINPVRIKVVVDYENNVKEAAEGNNWWEPGAQPFPQKGGYCDPPYNN